MLIEELNSLKETATEQLTADYACYFGKRDAEIILELIELKNRVWRIKEDCKMMLSIASFDDYDRGMDSMAKRILEIIET